MLLLLLVYLQLQKTLKSFQKIERPVSGFQSFKGFKELKGLFKLIRPFKMLRRAFIV